MRHVALALLCALALATPTGARAEITDGVAAIVGDEVVLLSEVQQAMQQVLARVPQGQQIAPEEMRQLRDSAVQSLIDDKLVLQIAKKQNVSATEEEIDNAIAGIASDERISVDEIYAAAEKQGMDRATYRDQLGKQITRMKIVQGSVQGRVRVSDDDVRELYEERYGNAKPGERIRVLHILISVPTDSKPDVREKARALATKLRDEARQSGDFAALARRYSAAPTAEQGGLTVFREDDAPAVIKAAIEGLQPGEITDVVSSPHGENVFQYLDRFDPASVPFEEVQERLRAELMERETMPEFEKWLGEARKGRYIEVVAPELK
jgi:peptidyl-prolyl cis-trans isomerase SurA